MVNVLSDDYILPDQKSGKNSTRINVLSDDYVLPKKKEVSEAVSNPVPEKQYAIPVYKHEVPENERDFTKLTLPSIRDIINTATSHPNIPKGLGVMGINAAPQLIEDVGGFLKSKSNLFKEKGMDALKQLALDHTRAEQNIFGVGGAKAAEQIANIPRNLPGMAGHLGLMDTKQAEAIDKKLNKFDFANYIKDKMGKEQRGDEPLQELIPTAMQVLPAVKPAMGVGQEAVKLAGKAVKKTVGIAPQFEKLQEKVLSSTIEKQKADLEAQKEKISKSQEDLIERERAAREDVGGSNPELLSYGLNKSKGTKEEISNLDSEINDLRDRLDKMKPINAMDDHVAASEEAINESAKVIEDARKLHEDALKTHETAQIEHEEAQQPKEQFEEEHAQKAREHQLLEDEKERTAAEHEQAKKESENVSEQTHKYFGKGRDYLRSAGKTIKKGLTVVTDFWENNYKAFIDNLKEDKTQIPEHALSDVQDRVKGIREEAKKNKPKAEKPVKGKVEKTELESELDEEVANNGVKDSTGNPYLDSLLKVAPSKGEYSAFQVIGKIQDFHALRHKMQQVMKNGESFANRELIAEAIKQTQDLDNLTMNALRKGLSPEKYTDWKWLNHGYSQQYFPIKQHPTTRAIQKTGNLPKSTIDKINTDEIAHTILQDMIKGNPQVLKDVLGEHYKVNPEDIFNPTEKTKQYIDQLPELHEHISNKAKAEENIVTKEQANISAKEQINKSQKEQRALKNKAEDEKKLINEKAKEVEQAKKQIDITQKHVQDLAKQHSDMVRKHKALVTKANQAKANISAQEKARESTHKRLTEAQKLKNDAEKRVPKVEKAIKELREKRNQLEKVDLKDKLKLEKEIKENENELKKLNETITKSTGVLHIIAKAGWNIAKRYARNNIMLP